MNERATIYGLVLMLCACSEPSEFLKEPEMYEAVLTHADTAVRFQSPVRVHPNVFPMDMTFSRIWLWWEDTKSSYEPPSDALRTAVAQIPSMAECELRADGWCAVQPGETALFLSPINYQTRLPRIAVAIFERTENSFGVRTYIVELSDSSGHWKVDTLEWHGVVN